tara:strand:- start:12962 stop:13873 length:912 start_codon:yes stop_codon:yes gene_type:complete
MWKFVLACLMALILSSCQTSTEESLRSQVFTFKDCENCPEMVVVKPGTYLMGHPAGTNKRWKDTYNNIFDYQHEVKIGQTFAVGKFEVTFGQWDVCALEGGCKKYFPADEGWGRGRRPVINVDWSDAKSYTEWLSRKTNKKYRLLSEAEWEYMARANTTTRYHFGDGIGQSDAQFDYDSRQKRTVSVGSFKSNAFGIHDVHGNVAEWVEDCGHSYEISKMVGHPRDYSPFESIKFKRTLSPNNEKPRIFDKKSGLQSRCDSRVVRGGSWDSTLYNIESADRIWFNKMSRNNNLGFRVTRDWDD